VKRPFNFSLAKMVSRILISSTVGSAPLSLILAARERVPTKKWIFQTRA